MKNKVIQKVFTVLLGLMMFSPGWAATQYCDFATGHQGNADFGDANGRILLSLEPTVNTNEFKLTVKPNVGAGNTQKLDYLYVIAGGNNPYPAESGSDSGPALDEISVTFTNTNASTSFTIQWSTPNWGGRWECTLTDVNLSSLTSCSTAPAEEDDEAPVMTSASLESKTHNSAVIAVAATDNVGVTKYVVYNNATKQGEYTPADGKITVTGLAQQTAYTFIIKAKDAAGNESDNSKEVTFTTDAFVYYKYATGHLGNAVFDDPNGRILLTLTKMGTNAVNVLVEPNNAGTIVDWVSATVNGVNGTIGTKSAFSTQNVGAISLQNVTLPATGTFAVSINWHTPSMGADGEWTTQSLQVATSELYVEQGVAVTGVSLPETLNLNVGDVQTLTATIAPSNASNQNVTWSIVSGNSYISLDQTGKVTANAAGTAVVRVTTEDGGFTDDCTITITTLTQTTWWGLGNNNEVDILYSITRNTNKTLTYNIKYYGDKQGLSPDPYITNDNGEHKAVNGTWTSEKTYETGTSINGIIKVEYAGGAAVIDYSYTVGAESEELHLPLRSLTMSETSASMEIGSQKTLTVTAAPAEASNSVTWTSNAEGVATVTNGVVTAVAEGTATITATSTVNTSITATCTVTVLAQVLTEPDALPAAPTVPAEQVKAVYSATYGADCNFGEWGSGTTYTQDTYGKKYVTTSSGYFGICFEGAKALNCSQMEYLHADVWVKDDKSIRFVPVHTGCDDQKGVVKNLIGNQWNSIDIPISDFQNGDDWSNVYQIKIDNAPYLTLWFNNVYFYTTQTKSTYVLSASVKDNEGGTASVSIAEVAKGGTATFTAEAACGYSFVGWWNNTTKVSTEATYTPTDIQEDLTLVAEFAFVGPSEAATVPSYDLVIPIYNEGAKEGVNMFASWGQHTSQQEVTIAGHKVMKYGNINFQGIAFEGNKRDVSDMKYIHLDIWSTKTGDIKFSLIWVGGETPVDVSLEGCQWNSVNIPLSQWPTADLTQIHQLKFDAQGGAIDGATILVQDIFFYAPNEFTLSETESNDENLTNFNNKVCDVTIGRTFEADKLYTLALPFDMTEAQVEETFRACTMYKLAESYWKVEGENMYIRFAPVTEFEAGTPILFTPTENIENVVAKDVTIKNGDCETATDLVTFHGTYSKKNLAAPNYILAEDQYLYPVVGDEYSINGMRGYFSFGASVPQAPKMARIILHEETTTDNAFLRNEKQEMRAKKVLENGRFVIIRDGARYGVLGVEE